MMLEGVELAVEKLRDDLAALGVRPGGVLLVHSSFKSLGPVAGGAESVIRGLLAALGENGTLLMPALSYAFVTPENPVFDQAQTPSNVGWIAETFRRRAGINRSLHPTHSICAAGRLADELTRDHGLDVSPCGPHSPLALLPQYQGQILMLGCGLEPNTSMHAVEERVEPVYLLDPPLEYQLTLEDGRRITRRLRPHNFRGWAQRYERIAEVMQSGLRRGRVLAAECFLLEASDFWAAALAKLSEDPLYFVEWVGE